MYHSVLKTQDDYINALRVAYDVADYLKPLTIFPYSVFCTYSSIMCCAELCVCVCMVCAYLIEDINALRVAYGDRLSQTTHHLPVQCFLYVFVYYVQRKWQE